MYRRTHRIPWILLTSLIIMLPFMVSRAEAGTIVAKPGKLDHFVITAPPSAVAGESILVRIDPYDANQNLITEYRGKDKGNLFSFKVSGSAEVSPRKLRAADFVGGTTIRITDKKAEIVELTVTEGGAVTPLASVQVPVLPNKLDRFSLNVPREATAGEVFQCRIIARDAFGNTKIDLPDIRSNLKVDFIGSATVQLMEKHLPPFKSGEMILNCKPQKAGKVRIVAKELNTHSQGESKDIQISHSHLDHFTIQGPNAAVAGQKFTLIISAYDVFENPVTDYYSQGDGVILLASGSGFLSLTSVEAKEFQDGQARVNLTYTKAEALRITAREMNREFSGHSEPILITPAEPDHFLVTSPAEAIAGEPFTIQIEALDRFNNLIKKYDIRGLEVYLSTDGTGQVVPATVSPAAFSKGKATVDVVYNRAESFTVLAALSKEALEKIIKERTRRAPIPPRPPAKSPEEIAREKEREMALKAREEALKAKLEAEEKRAREEAVKAREEARKARKKAEEKVAKPPGSKKPVVARKLEKAAAPPRVEKPSPPPTRPPEPPAVPSVRARRPAPVRVAKPVIQELEQVSLVESKGQAMVVLGTTGPVSYNAATGSAFSKEWIYIELFPARRNQSKVADLIKVDSGLVGDIQVEQVEAEKVKVSLQVLPPGISYVVSQQDRAIVVKIIKTQ